MSTDSFYMNIEYSQICIFESDVINPFNDWSDSAYNQGFAYRPESVSFRTLDPEGEHKINIYVNEPLVDLSDDVVRAIKVPFNIMNGDLEISGVISSKTIKVPVESYSIQIEFLKSSNDHSEVNIRFNQPDGVFSIVKSDEEILIHEDFELNSNPAI